MKTIQIKIKKFHKEGSNVRYIIITFLVLAFSLFVCCLACFQLVAHCLTEYQVDGPDSQSACILFSKLQYTITMLRVFTLLVRSQKTIFA